MRPTVSILAALATAGGAALVLLNTAPAAARPCPDGTRYGPVYVNGTYVASTCLPYFQPCDPGPCEPPPTGAPRQ